MTFFYGRREEPRRMSASRRPATSDATAAVVSAIVKEIRDALCISQEDWAHRAGVDRAYVGKVERAALNPTIYRLNRLLDAAGVSWREFGEALDVALAPRERSK